MKNVKVFGHRGYKGMYPENTIVGFQKAIDVGVDGLEIDVHLTKDGEVVVIHDEMLDRTTNGTGYVKDKTLKEIKSLYVIHQGKVTSERVPTLLEVLNVLTPYQHVALNIELKTYHFLYEGIEEKVLSIVKQYGGEMTVIYSSFHLPTLIRVKQLEQKAKIAWLLNQPIPQLHDYVQTFQLEGIHPGGEIWINSPDLFIGCDVIRVWTVNEVDQLEKIMKDGVDAVITDFPERALEIRKKLFG